MKTDKILTEIKKTEISVGDTYTLSADLGKFKKGEKIKVTKKTPSAEDIQLYLTNDKGVTDIFYLDKNDTFEELT
jgi:hypothetical protein